MDLPRGQRPMSLFGTNRTIGPLPDSAGATPAQQVSTFEGRDRCLAIRSFRPEIIGSRNLQGVESSQPRTWVRAVHHTDTIAEQSRRSASSEGRTTKKVPTSKSSSTWTKLWPIDITALTVPRCHPLPTSCSSTIGSCGVFLRPQTSPCFRGRRRQHQNSI